MPEAERPWRLLSRRAVVRDRHLDLDAEAVETGAGAVLDPYWVMTYPDWVLVVALTPEDRLVLVRQWRQGAKAWVLEPPGGVMDVGDADPCATAARELREETGYAAARLRLVASLWSDPAHNSNRLHVVLAEEAVDTGRLAREAGEELETVLLPASEALAGAAAGRFAHAMHLGGLLLALRAAGRLSF
ncbi:NUDIX hydrolase [Roseicella frigidaeris]|uniref:GDP-mannose pyrophosphatase n=1 Tax=Roseicella frigidaeris TaxID=2230885 RepID=A0A327MD52_9PROT|nr:NUDIX hydrolase [Roseicella frigidaeris]